MMPPPENFGSTAQIMLEVLDKAAVELSKIVTECMEMVATSGLSLQKSLIFALRCASENYQSFADGKFDDLEQKKQEILEQLQKFEESQIEAIEATSKIVREAVTEHAETVIAQISQQLSENTPKVLGTQKDPNVLLKDCYDMATPAIEKTFKSGHQRLEQIFGNCYAEAESKTRGYTDQLYQQVDACNARMTARMEETLVRFEQHINTIMEKLQLLLTQGSTQIDMNSEQLIQQAEVVLQKSLTEIDKPVKGWQTGLDSAYEDLGQELAQKHEQERIHTVEMVGGNLEEMNLFFTHLSSDHAEKAFETHRSYVAALNKIEKTCVQRLEHLHEYFSSLLAGYNERLAASTASETLSTEGHRNRLETSLSIHRGQVVDSATALVTHLKSDLNRNSEFLNEKIETVKNETVDHFKKQVKSVETEADRAVKEFRRGLSKVESSIKEIDDAGQAAAVTVTAYLGTVLSLEEE